MIIVKLQGGLGNQMLQYALGRHLSVKHATTLKLDASFLEMNIPGIVQRTYDLPLFVLDESISLATDAEIKYFQRYRRTQSRFHNIFFANPQKYIQECQFNFDPHILDAGSDIYLDGFWWTEKYFKDIESIIRKDFEFKKPIPDQSQDLLKHIETAESVCINVRRGDFVNHSRNSIHHGACSIEYFDLAVKTIAAKIENPSFFIFSDDIEWCREHLAHRYPYPCIIVTHDHAGIKFGHYLDLISRCKHQIIPNSSFGWWGAWLNRNPKKTVVAPKQWFYKPPKPMNTDDVAPAGWIQVSNF